MMLDHVEAKWGLPYSKKSINYIITFNLLIKKCFMQGQPTPTPLFSYIMVPPFQYLTFVPISPTTPGFISPTPDLTFASLSFHSGQLNELYCRQDISALPPHSATSLAEGRQLDNPSQNSINIQFPHTSHAPTINRSISAIPSHPQSSLPLERSHSSNMDVSYVNKKQKIKQHSKRNKEVTEDDHDYVPQSQRKKKQSSKYQENENRNIIPNQINQIFSFIQKSTKSGYLTQKLFKRMPHPNTYTIKRFYLYQSLLKDKLGHYANEKSLKLVTELYEPKCENWPEQEQRFYNKLCRILIRHFLYQDSIFIILTSKRMKSSKKSDHLRARHVVASTVLHILKGG